jgi:hypothetical protein
VEGGYGPGRDGRSFHLSDSPFLMEFQDIFDAAQVSEDAQAGLTILAEGFDDAIVGDAMRLIALEGGHQLRIYDDQMLLSRVEPN